MAALVYTEYQYVYIYIYMGVSINGGTPIAGWFIRENPIKMDDFFFRVAHDFGNLGIPMDHNLWLDGWLSPRLFPFWTCFEKLKCQL